MYGDKGNEDKGYGCMGVRDMSSHAHKGEGRRTAMCTRVRGEEKNAHEGETRGATIIRTRVRRKE